ncbi:MAG: MFS transporter [Firmicutes bacterium]|nr:MFS transporter [Bacillota bacterium]
MKRESIYSKNIILILAASFFFMFSPMLTTPLIAGYAEELGAGALLMGMIGGLMNLCSLFCRPFAGNLADIISKYHLTTIGSALSCLALLIYVLAPSSGWIIVGRLIHGVGYSFCSVCMSTWMSNMLPLDKVGTGMGLYGTMNALGMAIAPSVGIALYQRFGYRASFIFALAATLLIIVIIQFITDRGEPKRKLRDGAESGPYAAEQRRFSLEIVDVKVIPLAAIIMLFTIPYYATQSFLVSYSEARQLPVTYSLFFPIYAGALLVLRLSLKSLFDKVRFRYFLGGSVLSAAASIFLLGIMRNNFQMVMASIFMAGGYGLMCSICQSTAILMAGVERRGLANSTYYVGLDLGMAIGPIIGGYLYGNIPLNLFYPCLMVTLPMIVAVYWIFLKKKGY